MTASSNSFFQNRIDDFSSSLGAKDSRSGGGGDISTVDLIMGLNQEIEQLQKELDSLDTIQSSWNYSNNNNNSSSSNTFLIDEIVKKSEYDYFKNVVSKNHTTNNSNNDKNSHISADHQESELQKELLKETSGYKIDFFSVKTSEDISTTDNINNSQSKKPKLEMRKYYKYKGSCYDIPFSIEFIVVNQDRGNKDELSLFSSTSSSTTTSTTTSSFVDYLDIQLPILFCTHFKQFISHCKETKSLGLFLNSFQKISLSLFNRHQFFTTLYQIMEASIEINDSFLETTFSNPGGYYSNSFIFHPNGTPTLYLYWDIKCQRPYYNVEHSISIIPDPQFYSKSSKKSMETILETFKSNDQQCSFTEIKNLVNLIISINSYNGD
ncbi:hypothetical protein CYY_007563 [Polysphondylium violaceum]|uniref:Uncharacterized protein n=1 Tax=Polysphondylium violaceum TaxID=133409 RepID=A0A8J4UXM5_9MYCE|nr:hypothetical protein CYY_007563 [Polysphondylium violaceum]